MPETGASGPHRQDRLQQFMRLERGRLESWLDTRLPPDDRVPEALHRAMRHSVFAGGKRLRPLLVIAAGQACGAEPEELLPAAAAVELIHTYSLIHDDLPAFDDEELRRGKPTCHVLFGEAIAVLAGDALQALAFELLAQAPRNPDRAPCWLAATAEIARAAGSVGMCGGQTLDIQATGQQLDLDALRRLHAAKTGALLTASVLAGARVADAAPELVAALQQYGDALGLCFQIVDDLLDVEGTVEQLGKRPGGDADRQQPTFPALIGVQAARREAQQLRDRAIAALSPFGDEAWHLRELARFVVSRST